MANLDLTMFEERKQYLENMSKSFGKYAIDIGSINSMSFKIFDELFPISLLEYAVQLIRNSNVPILWNLSGLYYFSDKKRYFYRKEFFWTLIGNQDSIYTFHKEFENAFCPRVMGIDEHFFTRKKGYATTITDLTRHKVFDVALGRSELALRPVCRKLLGKDRVKVVVMDLSETYRSIAKQHFKNAMIVADRFHVIRLVNQQFIKTWAELDEDGRKNRGLLSLMRRHPDRMRDDQRVRLFEYLDKTPGLKSLYLFWQDLLRLLRMKQLKRAACKKILTEYLWIIEELKQIPFKHLQTLGHTLERWKEEIARMFRFSKTNGITEGLHNKMEMISRRAYGFRNFENYRLRVRVLCS